MKRRNGLYHYAQRRQLDCLQTTMTKLLQSFDARRMTRVSKDSESYYYMLRKRQRSGSRIDRITNTQLRTNVKQLANSEAID